MINKITAQQYDELLEILEDGWGEEEEVLEALVEFLQDYETIKSVLLRDRTFNRYTCDINSWIDLGWSILTDEAFEDEEDEEDEFFDLLRANQDNELALRNILIDQNWAISYDHGVAIGFDDDVNVVCHYVHRDI